MSLEIEDDTNRGLPDDYIVCDICDKLYRNYCTDHGPMEWLQDSSITRQHNCPSATATLPKALFFKTSSVEPGDIGVFALDDIRSQVKFGPLVGKQISMRDVSSEAGQDYMWDIFDRWKQVGRYILDASDEKHSNWMRFVKFAKNNNDQNLVAFQYRGELYFRTCRDIKAKEELLVWYEEDYCCDAKELGGQTLEGARFICKTCNIAFLSPTILAKHKKYRCVGKNTEECWVCQEQFQDRISMLKHLDNHMKAIVQTKEENKGRDTVLMNHQQEIMVVSKHQQTPPENSSYKCEKCGSSFGTQSFLSHHRLFHDCTRVVPDKCLQLRLKALGKMEICTLCRRQFSSRHALEKHTRNIHWRMLNKSRHSQGSGGRDQVLSNQGHSQMNSKLTK